MTFTQLDAMLAESGFDPDDVDHLTTVLSPLAELAEEAPAPSAELLALMGGAATEGATVHALADRAPAKRNRGVVAGALVLALSGVGATGLSAAANTLPSPWQHQVSDFSRHYLPFDFPEPPVELPHLAPAPHPTPPVAQAAQAEGGGLAGLFTQRPDRTGEEPSRSLARARSAARGDRPLIARHAGGVRGDDSTTASEPTARPAPSGTPSTTPSSSASPGAKPTGGPSRTVKPAASAPVKTIAPGKTPGVAGPRKPGAPRGGKYDLLPGALPVENPVQGPVSGPDVEVPGTGAPKESGTGQVDPPESPPEGAIETGPVLDRSGADEGPDAP